MTDIVYEFGYRHGRQLSHLLVDVTAFGRPALEYALKIVFQDIVHGEITAAYYSISPQQQLTLYRAKPADVDGAIAFPYIYSAPDAIEFVWNWLQQASYGPDEHDGAVKPGFHVWNDRYGIVDGCWQAFVAIRPMWIYIPK